MKKFLTEYKKDGHPFGDSVFANNWEEAQTISNFLDLGTVIGQCMAELPTDGREEKYYNDDGDEIPYSLWTSI